ncbi:MAG: hypothetical protein BMS9Abin25_1636 [Gammaproteobacteria bacterium]|nr:MAG: hypothetical protein BMS9Abin25_1636 [Gammaproteobacteria bacterium]
MLESEVEWHLALGGLRESEPGDEAILATTSRSFNG